jgi:hypothetical protein
MGSSICPGAKELVFLRTLKKEFKKLIANGQRL